MSSNRAAEAWVRLTSIREREKKVTLARLQSDLSRARERVVDAEAAREQEWRAVLQQVSGGVSAASLMLVSDALAVGRDRLETVRSDAQHAEAPVSEAVSALGDSARDRMVAERWLARRRERVLQARLRKETRADDDLAAQRAQRSDTGLGD